MKIRNKTDMASSERNSQKLGLRGAARRWGRWNPASFVAWELWGPSCRPYRYDVVKKRGSRNRSSPARGTHAYGVCRPTQNGCAGQQWTGRPLHQAPPAHRVRNASSGTRSPPVFADPPPNRKLPLRGGWPFRRQTKRDGASPPMRRGSRALRVRSFRLYVFFRRVLVFTRFQMLPQHEHLRLGRGKRELREYRLQRLATWVPSRGPIRGLDFQLLLPRKYPR